VTPAPDKLLLYCRAGFEKECAAEISERAAAAGIHGYARGIPGSAHVLFVPQDGGLGHLAGVDARELVFARQAVVVGATLAGLPERDRIGPLLAAAAALGGPYCAVWLEHPDTNEGKALSGLCRRLAPLFEKALAAAGLLAPERDKARRLHVFFTAPTSALVGSANPRRSAPWPLGIPRLKMPAAAPSRSALKLAEALLVFLTPEEQAERLHEGISAVDLGAAPGGWTWQLVRQGLHVTAVDNGALGDVLAPALASGQVEHLRCDGLSYRPRRPVHWLVCDMVEKPARIAALVAEWIAAGHAAEAIFNLKLPMKKRREELERCRELIRQRLDADGIRGAWRFRQLYHDREEVTGWLRRR